MSTTIADDRPVDPDDELLVAYLDGELDSAARDDVEQRLMDEESLRSRLQTLQASWDLLEALPEATTNDKLVESTLELVVEDIVSKSSIRAAHVESSRWPLILTAIAALSAIVAFATVRWMKAQTLRRELNDLAVAEHLDAYLYGQDLQLMRDLWADAQWNNMIKAAREVGGFSQDNVSLISDAPVDQRAEAITELSLEDRAILETRWDRLRRMDSTSREAVRKTAQAVAAQPDADVLLGTMNTYAVWRDTIPDELRERIEKSNGELRKKVINEAIGKTLEEITRQSAKTLKEETTEVIYAALELFLNNRVSDSQELAEKIEELGKQFNNADAVRRLAMRRMLGDVFWSAGSRVPSGPPSPIDTIRTITDDELLSIYDILLADMSKHADALEKLETLLEPAPFVMRDSLKLVILRLWSQEAINRNSMSSFRLDERSLLDRYKELDPDVRDALDLLPPEKMKAELYRLTNPRRFSRPFSRRPPSR